MGTEKTRREVELEASVNERNRVIVRLTRMALETENARLRLQLQLDDLANREIERSLTLGSFPALELEMPTDEAIGTAVHKAFGGWNWDDCPEHRKPTYVNAGKAARAL